MGDLLLIYKIQDNLDCHRQLNDYCILGSIITALSNTNLDHYWKLDWGSFYWAGWSQVTGMVVINFSKSPSAATKFFVLLFCPLLPTWSTWSKICFQVINDICENESGQTSPRQAANINLLKLSTILVKQSKKNLLIGQKNIS